ncbi:MAG: hypothetical protein GXP30_11645 [Verrucomicrobia bacterium]|nr:hypothetical protein [Verrucomicrobiota bacterium]
MSSQPSSKTTVTFQDQRSSSAKQIRREAIAADISRIRGLRAKHGDSWEKWVEEVKPWREKLYKRSLDSGAGIFENGLFFRYFYNSFYQALIDEGEDASPLRMIRALHAELDQLGIDLLVVPFPLKEEVYGASILPGAPEDGVIVPERQRIVLSLLEAGVEVVDLTETFRISGDLQSLFYPYEDPHPADLGIQIAAEAIANRLKRYHLPPEIYGLKTRLTHFTMPEKFQERREGSYRSMPPDPTYPATLVETVFGDVLPKNSFVSPLLIMGDSFTRCPDLYGVEGGNVRDHISHLTGMIPGSLRVHGSAGQSMGNLALAGNTFLEHRQVVVFIFFSSRMFTKKYPEGHGDREWQVVPFAKRFRQ